MEQICILIELLNKVYSILFKIYHVGSFYGGLQSLKKKENYYLIDFSHQLLKLYLFEVLISDSNHIVSSEILSQKTQDCNSFIYIQ